MTLASVPETSAAYIAAAAAAIAGAAGGLLRGLRLPSLLLATAPRRQAPSSGCRQREENVPFVLRCAQQRRDFRLLAKDMDSGRD
jgi:hypothetical protein